MIWQYDDVPLSPHSGLPYWERCPPIESRPITSSPRRPLISSGNGKIVVYQTKKLKDLKAKAKKKREKDEALLCANESLDMLRDMAALVMLITKG